jgi:O-antigen/teichoic acid export membrane protein
VHPRKFVRDSIGFAFSQYILRATLMLRGLIAARLLGPSSYGAWMALQIMMDYGPVASFGTQQGLDQMVPPRIVAGDPMALRRVKSAALFNILLTTLVFTSVCMTWAWVRHSRVMDDWGPLGIGVALACVLVANLSNWQTSILRSHGDIATMSGWIMLQGAVGGVLGLVLTPFLGKWGLLWGWFAGSMLAFGFSTVRSRHHAAFVPAPAREGAELVRIGLPMFVFILSTVVMRNLDRLIILRFLGTQQLGYYSLSVMALTLLLYLPDAVTYVLYPRLLHQFDGAGRDPASIRPVVLRVLQASSILVPALAGIGYLFARPVVVIVLPKFLPGVEAMRVLCFGAGALAFSGFASIVLMTLGHQSRLMVAAILGTVLYAAIDFVAVKTGFGITGVAWGTLLAYVLNGAVLTGLALGGLHVRGRALASTIVRLFGPLAFGVALAAALDRYTPGAGHPLLAVRALRVLGETVAFLGVYGATVHPLTPGLGMRQMVSEFDVPILGTWFRRLGAGASGGDAT